MARLVGTSVRTTDTDTIRQALAPIGVDLALWPVDARDARALLAQPGLDADEKERVLVAHDHYFDGLRTTEGYTSRDLIVLHPDTPGLDAIMARFDKPHTHDDDEVRYIVDGEGMFGFVLPNGEQLRVTVLPGEYIRVPKHTEHWFELTAVRRIKAVRYFSGTDGWVPRYTSTALGRVEE